MPEPRSGHSVVVVDSLIYLIGGFTNSQHHASDSFWSYNPATNSWNQSLPSLNHARADLAAVSEGDTIWVFGGRHSNSMVEEVERYIVGDSSWEVVGTMPDPRMGLGAIRVGDVVYLFGGKRSIGMFAPPTNRVDIYDLRTGVWTQGPSMLQARTNFGYSLKADTLICAGGSYLDPLASVEQLSFENGWSVLPNLDEPRSNSAAVFFQGNFVILGGYTSGGQSVTNLELVNNLWQEFPGLALPRYNHTAVVFGGDIYVMGGRNGQQVLASHERYSIDLSIHENGVQPTATFEISQPWPNPFNHAFEFQVTLPVSQSGDLQMIIYDLAGHQIDKRRLSGIQNGDRVHIQMNQIQNGLASGIYFLVVEWGQSQGTVYSTSKRIVYLK